jgi:hypothetical protein
VQKPGDNCKTSTPGSNPDGASPTTTIVATLLVARSRWEGQQTPPPSGYHVARSRRVSGTGGPVVQILTGPFPLPDSAGPILSQIQNGPISNSVLRISGRLSLAPGLDVLFP